MEEKMIKRVHTMFYGRNFLRDKPGLKARDAGEVWLFFDIPEADMGCHPADASGNEGAPYGTQLFLSIVTILHKQ